jgi:uncharacterized protein involved in exopolysaccharide biosynthesis
MNREVQGTAPAPRQATSREFLAILFRRKLIILGLFAVTTATVLTLAFATPIEYVSSGRVLVKRGEKESLLAPGRRVYSDWEEDMGSEVEVVKSSPVIERARQALREEAGPGRTRFKLDPKNVDVEVSGRTNVVLIGYRDLDPQTAKADCEALLGAYVEFRQNDFSLAYPRNFFEGEMQRVQQDLDHWITMRRNFASRSNVVDLPSQKVSAIQRLSELTQRRSVIESDLAEAEMIWRKTVELSNNENIDLPTFTSNYSNEAALVDLKRQVVEQELRLAHLRENLRDDAPDVVGAMATLDTVRAILHREVEARVAMSKARVDVLRARLEAIRKDEADAQQVLAGLPDKEMSLDEMDHQIDVLKLRYNELAKNSDQARVTEKTTSQVNVVLLSHASNPTPGNARDYVRLALAPAFSIVVGIGLAFFMDGLDLTVRTASHAEEAIDLPVLATLNERRRSRRGHPTLTLESPAP